MTADGGEQLADVAVGGPGDHADPPARPADPQQLADHALLAGDRDGVAGRQHHLEGAVGEGEILGLAFQEGHLQPFRLGASPGRLQQLGDVDADDPAEAAGGGQRGAAAAAGHVQHPLTGVEIDGLAEQLADEQGARPDGGVAHRPATGPLWLRKAEAHGTPLVGAVASRLAVDAGSGQVTGSEL
jgi:hypothetical protein